MANGYITESVSKVGAPILYMPKKDKTLQLYVDYYGLNCVIVKNYYPLPLIKDLLDHLASAKKINLYNVYYHIYIKYTNK